MKTKDYKSYIQEKYGGFVDYIIKVIKSCETDEQLNSAHNWGANLIASWISFEARTNKGNFVTTVTRSSAFANLNREITQVYTLKKLN